MSGDFKKRLDAMEPHMFTIAPLDPKNAPRAIDARDPHVISFDGSPMGFVSGAVGTWAEQAQHGEKLAHATLDVIGRYLRSLIDGGDFKAALAELSEAHQALDKWTLARGKAMDEAARRMTAEGAPLAGDGKVH